MCGETATWAEMKVVFVPCVMRNYTFRVCRSVHLHTFK